MSIFGKQAIPNPFEVAIFTHAAYRALIESGFIGDGPFTEEQKKAYVVSYDAEIDLQDCLADSALCALCSPYIRDLAVEGEECSIQGMREDMWAGDVLFRLAMEYEDYWSELGVSLWGPWKRIDAAWFFSWVAQSCHFRELSVELPSRQLLGFAFRVESEYWEDTVKEVRNLLNSRMVEDKWERLELVNVAWQGAWENFREGRFPESVGASNRALELMLATVVDRRGWGNSDKMGSEKMIRACCENGLEVFKLHKEWMDTLVKLLNKGVPKVRNRSGSVHKLDREADPITAATARLVIDLTAAAILFLAEVGADPDVPAE